MSITKAKTFRNIIYSSFTKGATVVCIGVSSSVVARNLSASDYGVVGFATIIIGFLRGFSDLGLGNAVIRRPTLDQNHIRTAFTMRVVLGLFAFGAAFLIAPFAHHLFNHPATGNVVRFLALDFLVSTVGFIPMMMLTRERQFGALVVPGVISAVVRCILAVTLILLGWKYWAVVVADVSATLAGGIAVQVAKKVPVGLRFNWEEAKDYLQFGLPLLGTGVLVFLIFNLDNFLVGSRMGSVKLGYYALAFAWGSFICGLLDSTVNSVMLPTFSAIQNDIAAMRRWYLKTVDLVAFLAVAANTALLANTHYFLVTLLGKGTDKWLPAEMSLKILCVYGIVRVMTEPIGSCVLARGRTKVLLHANAVGGAIELALILAALRTGRIELVAAAVLLAYTCGALYLLPLLRSEFSVTLGDLVAQLWPVIPAVVGGCAITSLLPDSLGNSIVTLGCRGLFTALAVALIHGFCTRFRCFREAGGMISQNFARVRA
jgi:lipopolysaccharide exporter